MARYKVILAYDGTHFRGFQRQVSERTVQGEVEQALQDIGWQGSSITASGRTDTGVHATGQVVAFDLDWAHSPTDLRAALNASLPPDVSVRSVRQIHDDFHPRFDAISRSYRYHVYISAVRDPLKDRYAWRVWPGVEFERLERAAEYLIGEHDFSAFGTPPDQSGGSIRVVESAGWHLDNGDLIFTIEANAFLYRMVRRLVSYQIEIGQGKFDVRSIQMLLERPPTVMVQGLAPPQGLFLSEVSYSSIYKMVLD
jgi:tRNA pseudouridine38-40 synthase